MERQKIKTELLVHDLKGPLAIIEASVISLLERNEKYGPLTEKQKKVLERVLRNTKITRTLVNDTLEVGRSSEGILIKSEFDISVLIKETLVEIFDLNDHRIAEEVKDTEEFDRLKDILNETGIHLLFEKALWHEKVYLDEGKMRQIFRNLMNNALKYRRQVVEINIIKENNFIVFSIHDDGEGIPESFHEKIFECYFQMDHDRQFCVRGHGLGLAGVQVLVEDMGGELLLESHQGGGAIFSVRIPLSGV